MIYNSNIHHQEFLYIRLQGLIWEINGLNAPFNLDINTGNILANIYRETDNNLPLVINCKGIIDNDDHSFSPIFKLINDIHRPIYFINSKDLILTFRQLKDEFISQEVHFFEHSDKTVIIYEQNKLKDIDELYSNCNKIEINLVNNYVSDCFEIFDNKSISRLPSTPIAANGVYNSSKLISDPKAFMWVSIKLSDELNNLLKSNLYDDKYINQLKLLSVSLRSSPFAAAVGLLNKIEVNVIDHLGPKKKIFDIEELQNIFWESEFTEYIFIGDFIFGGTEIKLAQTFAMLTGCKLEKALVIGNLFPLNSFSEYFNISSLVCLKGLNEKAKFGLFEDNINK